MKITAKAEKINTVKRTFFIKAPKYTELSFRLSGFVLFFDTMYTGELMSMLIRINIMTGKLISKKIYTIVNKIETVSISITIQSYDGKGIVHLIRCRRLCFLEADSFLILLILSIDHGLVCLQCIFGSFFGQSLNNDSFFEGKVRVTDRLINNR